MRSGAGSSERLRAALDARVVDLAPQRPQQPAQPAQLAVRLAEPPPQPRELSRRGRVGLGMEGRPKAPLDPQPLALQLQRLGVPRRQGVLELSERGLVPPGEEGFEGVVVSGHERLRSLSIEPPAGRGMGRAAHLRRLTVPLAALLATLVAAAPAQARHDAPPLSQRLGSALSVAGVPAARTAALAVDLATGSVVYARNERVPMIPASNEKLALAYAALLRLGPGYRFHTEVVGLGRLDGDTWKGDLVLQGHGDPTLGRRDLEALARDLRAWGIRRVTGAVLADETAYDSRRTGPGWKARYFIQECAPLSALVVDRGLVGGWTSRDPAAAAAVRFRRVLRGAGIRVAKPGGRAIDAPDTAFPLAQDLSEPLSEIVRVMGRDSDNFVAEMLLKQLGAAVGAAGTTAAGAAVVREALAEAGVPLAGVRIADGSGLSRLDRLTAEALVAILLAGSADPVLRDAFLASLAVAGVDGTLSHRLQRRPARGQVIAKTGTTSYSSALSGFVRGRYAFALLVNGNPVAREAARRAQDRFATALAGS